MNAKLEEAISLYKKGNRSQASNLLVEIVKQEPNNATAWYGLSLCLDDPDKKIYCLERVLKLNPSHKKAQQILENLHVGGNLYSNQKITESQHQPITQKKSVFNWKIISILGICGMILICVVIIGATLIGMNLYKSTPTPIPPTSIPRIPPIITGKPVEYVPILPDKFEIDYSNQMNETVVDGTEFLSFTFDNKEAVYNGDLVSGLYFIVIYPNESKAILEYPNLVNTRATELEGVKYNEIIFDGTNTSTMYMGNKYNIIEGAYASRIKNAVLITVGYTPFNPDTITLEFIKGFMEGDLLKVHKLGINKFFN